MQPAATAAGTRLRVDCEADFRREDRPAPREAVLLNLLSNAIKFTARRRRGDGVRARVDPLDWAEVEVRDTGRG